jgi:hypothetical protein
LRRGCAELRGSMALSAWTASALKSVPRVEAQKRRELAEGNTLVKRASLQGCVEIAAFCS